MERLRAGAPPKQGAEGGGYVAGMEVMALHDITMQGKVIVKKDTKGAVTGPSKKDTNSRVIVQFQGRARKASSCWGFCSPGVSTGGRPGGRPETERK